MKEKAVKHRPFMERLRLLYTGIEENPMVILIIILFLLAAFVYMPMFLELKEQVPKDFLRITPPIREVG